MPILGYLLYVGGTLLALLFVADIYVPKQAAREEVPHTYNIPITAAVTTSAPVVFSGETRDFGRPPPMTVVDIANQPQQQAAQAPTQPAQVQAQAPTTAAAKHETKPARKKVARRRTLPPENSYAQIPDEWRSRYTNTGMAFARPFGW